MNKTIYHCEYASCKFLWFRSRGGNSDLPLGFMQEWTHLHRPLECSCFLQHFLPECILTHERGNRQKRVDGGDSITKMFEAIQILLKRQVLTLFPFERRNHFQQELHQNVFPLRNVCRIMLQNNCDEDYWRITYSVYKTPSLRHVVSNIENNKRECSGEYIVMYIQKSSNVNINVRWSEKLTCKKIYLYPKKWCFLADS